MIGDAIATVYELSVPGREGIDLPESDVPFTALPAEEMRAGCELPEPRAPRSRNVGNSLTVRLRS